MLKPQDNASPARRRVAVGPKLKIWLSETNGLFAERLVYAGKLLSVRLGSLLGTQYDFTKMTNAELLSAAKSLGGEGKISTQAEMELMGVASGVDYASIDRSPEAVGDGVAKSLADSAQKDFLAYLQHMYQWTSAQPGSKGSEIYLDTLNELSKYQSA